MRGDLFLSFLFFLLGLDAGVFFIHFHFHLHPHFTSFAYGAGMGLFIYYGAGSAHDHSGCEVLGRLVIRLLMMLGGRGGGGFRCEVGFAKCLLG